MRSTKIIIFLFVLSFILACNNTTENNDRGIKCPKHGGSLRLVIKNFDKKNQFPPLIVSEIDKSICCISNTGLFQINPATLDIEKALCKRYELDSSETIYIFHLDSLALFHKNVCFKNKERRRNVMAYDVKYTFELLASPKYGSANFTNTIYHIKGAKKYFKLSESERDTSNIEGIQIISPYTLKVTLERPSQYFLRGLAHPAAAILPFEAINSYAETSRVGIGPFFYKETDDSSSILFLRDDSFFMFDSEKNRLPYLDSIVLTKTNDPEQITNMFINNECDAILLISKDKISEIIKKLPKNSFRIYEANNSSLLGYSSLYNIVRSNVKGLYTNNLNIIELQNVYIEHNH